MLECMGKFYQRMISYLFLLNGMPYYPRDLVSECTHSSLDMLSFSFCGGNQSLLHLGLKKSKETKYCCPRFLYSDSSSCLFFCLLVIKERKQLKMVAHV